MRHPFHFLQAASPAILLAICLASCLRPPALDIPEGDAVRTLKDFAKQANVEIVFDAQSVVGVRTRAVSGNIEPRVALARMVADTVLTMEQDRATGAYAVFRLDSQWKPPAALSRGSE